MREVLDDPREIDALELGFAVLAAVDAVGAAERVVVGEDGAQLGYNVGTIWAHEVDIFRSILHRTGSHGSDSVNFLGLRHPD